MRRKTPGFLSGLFWPPVAFEQACWQPAADVCRTRHGWLVKLDLAGVRPEDINVLARGNTLIVQGERHDCQREEGTYFQSMEICYSRFERHIELPLDLGHAHITTEFDAGMLLVRIRTGEERP
jgi:HSP20 family protein